MEDHRYVKVDILIQQEKYADAGKILSSMLKEDPHNVTTLVLLAEIKLQQDEYNEAHAIVDGAISKSPDMGDLFYLKSRIFLQEDKLLKGEELVQQAIRLDPYDADYFALLANIKNGRKQFDEALESADKALEINPENLLALNARSTALVKLDRSEESFVTIEGALKEDPNNPYTHANYGWGLLEEGNHEKSLVHFKQALSLDPNFEYAQAGLLEAIKAKNPIYRLFLKYVFFMSKLTEKYQWGVIIGFYIGFRLLRVLAKNNPALQPYLYPLLVVLAVLAFSTWVLGPISNLFLRFNKYGQLLLDDKEKMSSNFVALGLATFVIGLLLYVVLSNISFLAVAVYGFAMMVPCGVMFTPSKYENMLLYYTIAMAIIGAIAIVVAFISGELVNMWAIIFLVGFVAFQWIANYAMIAEDNRDR